MTQSDLMQEIEEELQNKRLAALWQRYGTLILAAALAVVIGTAGYTFWTNHRQQAQEEHTAALMTALDNKDEAKQIAALDDFAKANPDAPVAALAQLRSAGIAARMGDKAKAIALYDALAKDEKADAVFRQLADFLSVRAQMDDGDAAQLQKRLEPLLADSAWRFTAKEYSGYLALKAGDEAKAKQLFTELSQDDKAPDSIKQRAGDMLHLFAGGE